MWQSTRTLAACGTTGWRHPRSGGFLVNGPPADVRTGRVSGAGIGTVVRTAPGFVTVSIPGEPFLALTAKMSRC